MLNTLTDTALNKLATYYLSLLKNVKYKLNDVEKEINFFDKKVEENTVMCYVFFDENYKGTITNIRVMSNDNEVLAEDNKVYQRTTDKGLYIAFKHEFTEV